MAVSTQDLLSSLYSEWDLVTEPEKEMVTRMDDKFNRMGSVSPEDMKKLKKLLREVRQRGRI